MNLAILLLDCSLELEQYLKRQGFDVASGSTGFVNDRDASLPAPMYEYDIVIFNPQRSITEAKGETQDFTVGEVKTVSTERSPIETYLKKIRDRTFSGPVADFGPLHNHVERAGAIVLFFLNNFSDDLSVLNNSYRWIPNIPEIAASRDFKPITTAQLIEVYKVRKETKARADTLSELLPLADVENLKIPVCYKLIVDSSHPSFVPLFLNRQGDWLGFSLKLGSGQIIALPEYLNNESVIHDFLNRVVPRFRPDSTPTDVVDAFLSPREAQMHGEMEQVSAERNALNERFERAKVELALAKREKRKLIESDSTARLIISYHKQAIQDEERALFYLYKIIDGLQNKFGGETAAKKAIETDDEWRLIGKIANASYGDIRHAPKPADKITE